MFIKKILIILLCLFAFTGCKIQDISNDDVISNVNLILNRNVKYINKDAVGYQYYLPAYISVKDTNDFNKVLYYEGKTFYMYVDVVSYYHNIQKEYKVNKKAYISEKLNQKNKYGYLQVNKVDNKYYIQMMYNYAKIEAYVNDYELVDSISSISYILSSIKYNDNTIETLLGDKKYNLSDNETYNIFETKETSQDNFLDYINEYDNYSGESSAESLIEKKELESTQEED